MGAGLSDSVAAGAESSEDCIACRSLLEASRQSAVCFHVPDLSHNGAALSEQLSRQFQRIADILAQRPAGMPLRSRCSSNMPRPV